MQPTPLDQIDAIVLAGGLGARLSQVLPRRQKVTAPVGGRPFLERLLAWLGDAGVARIVLAAGHRAADVQAIADARNGASPPVVVSVEPAPHGTGGATRLASRLTTSDPVLVLNGDSFADIDLAAFRRFHLDRRARVTLALVSTLEPGRYGAVETDPDGLVRSFREKPDARATPVTINAGIYLFERAALADLPERYPLSLERDVFPVLIGKRLYAKKFNSGFIDIGTPESLQAAEEFFGAQ
jgi:NDP-sugar pyrophosphorylase family protein